MSSKEDETPYGNQFFFSFYELSNGEIVVLQFIENLTSGVVTSNVYEFRYANSKLKSGEIKKYQFGNAKPNTYEMSKEFFDWFDASPPVKDLKNNFAPYEDEIKCVEEFYLKFIESKKDIKTETIEV